MPLPTEPIGSIPRPAALLKAICPGGDRDSTHSATTRETTFAKIQARILGTTLAAAALGVS